MIPNGSERLLRFAGCMLQGLEMHRPSPATGDNAAWELPLKMANLEQALTAAQGARNTQVLAKNRLAMADKALKTWLTKARLVVMLARGLRWSESWVHTGFTDHKIRVPKSLDQRISLARSLVTFFARHPEFGVGFAEVTAARGRAIYERVVQSREMLQLANDDFCLTKQQRDGAEKDLRNTLHQLGSSLDSCFQKSDPRWADFGVTPKQSRRRGRKTTLYPEPIPFVQPTHGSPRHVAAA